jgi:DUF2934 family protein
MAKTTSTKTATRRSSTPPRPKNNDVMTSPSPDAIARRAFELFLERGGSHGHHLEDWLRAERELRATH